MILHYLSYHYPNLCYLSSRVAIIREQSEKFENIFKVIEKSGNFKKNNQGNFKLSGKSQGIL